MNKLIYILAFMLVTSISYSREIKKTVIMSNQTDSIEDAKPVTPPSESTTSKPSIKVRPIKTSTTEKIETPKQLADAGKKPQTTSQPFFNKAAISFCYNDINTSGKPSIPYFRGYMPSKWIMETSISYYNINKNDNYFLFETIFLYPLSISKNLSLYSGAGISSISDPENKFRISSYIEIEKELIEDISFAVQYQPFAYEIDNEENLSRFILNGSFTSKIIWNI